MDFLPRLLMATALGALIGLERQWRQRNAGLRTNALVAAGAVAFATVALSPLANGNPAPILGQIITGIGFLGAGVIFKEDFNVRGLNTAATLWCSAAVGTFCGMGMQAESLALAATVVGINLVLRPISQRMSLGPAGAASEMESTYRIYGTFARRTEAPLRALLLHEASTEKLRVHDLHMDLGAGGRLRLNVDLVMAGKDDHRVEELTARVAALPGVLAVRWQLQKSATHFE